MPPLHLLRFHSELLPLFLHLLSPPRLPQRAQSSPCLRKLCASAISAPAAGYLARSLARAQSRIAVAAAKTRLRSRNIKRPCIRIYIYTARGWEREKFWAKSKSPRKTAEWSRERARIHIYVYVYSVLRTCRGRERQEDPGAHVIVLSKAALIVLMLVGLPGSRLSSLSLSRSSSSVIIPGPPRVPANLLCLEIMTNVAGALSPYLARPAHCRISRSRVFGCRLAKAPRKKHSSPDYSTNAPSRIYIASVCVCMSGCASRRISC